MIKKSSISDAELEILNVLWQSKVPLSAYDIRSRLNETRRWERTTVLTLIRRLVDKGIMNQEKRDVYYYSPNIAREDYRKEETQNFITRLYQGNSKDLVAALFQDDNLTQEDIEELRVYFNQPS